MVRVSLLLTLLTAVNLLNYIDRGLVAGGGTMIKGCVSSLDECSAASQPHHHNYNKSQCLPDAHDDDEGDHVPGCSPRCRVCGTKCSSSDTVKQTGFGITDFDLGVIQSSFMLGYMGGSFIFSSLASKAFPIYRLLAVGMTIWTLSALLCAFSGWYGSLYLMWAGRIGSGVGEAALATMALPHLDDVVPARLKGRYMSIYFAALPVGTALGFVFAGVVSATLSWEWTFLLEAALMPPFIAVFWCSPGLQGYVVSRRDRPQQQPMVVNDNNNSRAPLLSDASMLGLNETVNLMEEAEEAEATEDGSSARQQPVVGGETAVLMSPVTAKSLRNVVWREVLLCLKSTTFVLTVMGLGMYTFTTAGLAFYMPQFLQNAHPCDKHWEFSNTQADMAFGALAMVCGFCGVLAGGWALDYFGNATNQVVHALRIGFYQLVLATGLLFVAIFASNVYFFFTLAGLGVFVVFSTTTPSSRALLGSVPTEARPVAMALSNMLVHLFGDVPSPILIGAVSDAYSPTFALFVAWLGLIAACGFWFAAWKSCE